jgi:hypothetical protein
MFLNILHKYKLFYFDSRYLTTYSSHEDSISVDTNNSKLILLHLLARAFFIENKFSNLKLEKKFNSRICINLKKFRKENNLGLQKTEDFYSSPKTIHFNNFYLLKYYWSLILKHNLKQIAKYLLLRKKTSN